MNDKELSLFENLMKNYCEHNYAIVDENNPLINGNEYGKEFKIYIINDTMYGEMEKEDIVFGVLDY